MSRHSERPPSLWRNRDYMLLWTGQMVSYLGSGISQIAAPLLILALTNSPTMAGIAGAVGTIPYLIFSLPAGALIDRWDRKRVMIVCDVGRALSAGSVPIAAAFGRLTVGQLLITTAIEGSLFVFFNIAEVACLPRVVPGEQLPNATAQNEGGGIATSLIAPPLGGFLYQSISHTVPYLFDAVSYAASVVSLSLIRTTFQGERTISDRRLREEIAEGIGWLWRQHLIRYMAVLTGGLNLSGAGLALIVIVQARSQHAPATAIGLIFSIGSVGGLLGAMVAPRIQRRFGFGQVIISTTWIGAVLWPLLAVAPNPVLLGLVCAGLFVTSPIYNAVQFSYRLGLIPDALQGRVNSAFRLLAFGFQPLGAAFSGILLDRVGVGATVAAFAAVGLVLAVATTINPQVRGARPIAAGRATAD